MCTDNHLHENPAQNLLSETTPKVTVQSLLTGIIYLLAAVMSWTVFAESRDTSIARKNAMAMAETMQSTTKKR